MTASLFRVSLIIDIYIYYNVELVEFNEFATELHRGRTFNPCLHRYIFAAFLEGKLLISGIFTSKVVRWGGNRSVKKPRGNSF